MRLKATTKSVRTGFVPKAVRQSLLEGTLYGSFSRRIVVRSTQAGLESEFNDGDTGSMYPTKHH